MQAGGHRFDPGQLHQTLVANGWGGSEETLALLPDVEDQQALVLNIGQQEAGWKRKIGSVPNASQGAKGV